MAKRYQYDIFEAGSTTRTVMHLHEDTPLLNFAVGDIIHGKDFGDDSIDDAQALRVTGKKHVLGKLDDDSTYHLILIYTEDAGISKHPLAEMIKTGMQRSD